MSRTVAIYLHKETGSNSKLNLETLWVNVKSLLGKLGAEITSPVENDILLNPQELSTWETSFIRFFGIKLSQQKELSALTVYFESVGHTNKSNKKVTPCANSGIEVDEFLRIAMERDEASISLFQKLIELLRVQGNYEFSFSLDEGRIDPVIVVGGMVLGTAQSSSVEVPDVLTPIKN